MTKPPIFPADDIVVVGTSTGGLEALRAVLAGLPAQFQAAVLIVMHVGAHESILPSLLASHTRLPVRHARDGDALEPGRVLVAPPDQHLLVRRHGRVVRVLLSRSARENHFRPAIDPLFRSAAAAFGPRATGVILTGGLDDGTAGLQAIKACGGTALVQLPEDAVAPGMPASAIANVDVDSVLRKHDIGDALVRVVERNLVGVAAVSPPPANLEIENRLTAEGSDMDSLAQIATPSTFTCPECHGALWQVKDATPQRFRCHTGHAFTERTLAAQQDTAVEEALWSAIRALQEKERLLRQMAEQAMATGHAQSAGDYGMQAAEALRAGEVLRRLLTGTAVNDAGDQFGGARA